jgi:hypothetical protein
VNDSARPDSKRTQLALVQSVATTDCTLEEQSLVAFGKVALELDTLNQKSTSIEKSRRKKVILILLAILAAVQAIGYTVPFIVNWLPFIFVCVSTIIVQLSTRAEVKRLKRIRKKQKLLTKRLREMSDV